MTARKNGKCKYLVPEADPPLAEKIKMTVKNVKLSDILNFALSFSILIFKF